MKPLTKRDKITLVVVGVLAFLYVVYTYVYQPQVRQISEARRRVTVLTAELQRLRTMPQAIAQAEVEVERLQSELAVLQKRVPAQFVAASFMSIMTGAIGQSGVELVNVNFPQVQGTGGARSPAPPTRPTAVAGGASYQEWPVDLQVRGTFPQVVRLLRSVEEQQQLIVVEQIQMAPEGVAQTQAAPERVPQLQVALRLKTFTLR